MYQNKNKCSQPAVWGDAGSKQREQTLQEEKKKGFPISSNYVSIKDTSLMFKSSILYYHTYYREM